MPKLTLPLTRGKWVTQQVRVALASTALLAALGVVGCGGGGGNEQQ